MKSIWWLPNALLAKHNPRKKPWLSSHEEKGQKMCWEAIQNTKEVLGGHLMFFLRGWKHEENVKWTPNTLSLKEKEEKHQMTT